MWAWRKKQSEEPHWRGAARAGLAGAPREEIMREALHELALHSGADRIGVWLEPDLVDPQEAHGPVRLCGLLWENESEETPPGWQKLSLESPLPGEILATGQSVDQELDDTHTRTMIGPLVGLRHALWTPIEGKGHLRGVLLSGSRKKVSAMPRELAESVAAQLALALEWQQEHRLARERQADVRLSKQILTDLGGRVSTDTILSQLAASCMQSSSDVSGAGASFALIGYRGGQSSISSSLADMEFLWESGEEAFTHSVEREPLAALWRQACESGRVLGTEPPAAWNKDGLSRLVAIPLRVGEEILGVLIAGIPRKTSSLATLDRLELRASLAVSALECRRLHLKDTHDSARRQFLFESSPDPTILLDAQGNISAANRSAKILLEESRAEHPQDDPAPSHDSSSQNAGWYIGGRFAHLFRARDQQRIEQWSARALSGARGNVSEILESGESELVNGVVVRPRAPLAAGDDLSAIVLAPAASQEASLQRSRADAELHNVLEWVEEGIVLFDANNNIRAMNTRFAQIAGLSPQEAAASPTLDALIAQLEQRAAEPQNFASRWRELARASEGGTREELQLARPVPRVLERSVRPVLDSTGHRLGRVEIYRDLTAQRVFQAKLLQTEKLAALGQMITGIAHELSNPLTSILGYSQRLLVRKDANARGGEIRQIYEEAERASTILRQLLLSARETRPERKRLSLNQIILRAMELQRFGSAAEKIRIELDLDPSLPFISGDPGQLQQVLMNLIGNARQAIVQDEKAGTIRLRTARVGDRRILLQVIDDGPGIPEAILSRIFDPFFTTKPAGVGTGLGLAIVLSVVREHGGYVNVSSPPEGGAIFSVELPAAVEVSIEPPPRQDSIAHELLPLSRSAAGQKNRAPALPLSPSHVSSHASYRGTRVLVVEDEPTVARLIADLLQDEGLNVDVLFDGREALQRASREHYDMVICDMKMPGLDGQHFYQSLARDRHPLLDRFLFVTGDVIAQQTQDFLERNHLPHVAKPFRVEELTEKVYGVLDTHAARGGQSAAVKKAH